MGWFKKTVDLFKGPDWEGIHEALQERTKETEEIAKTIEGLGKKMEDGYKRLTIAVRDRQIDTYEYFTCKLADLFVDVKKFEAGHDGMTYKEWLRSLLKPNDTEENFEWNKNQYLAEHNGFRDLTIKLVKDAYDTTNATFEESTYVPPPPPGPRKRRNSNGKEAK